VNLAVGAFINGLSPRRGPKSGVDKGNTVVPGPLPGRRHDELDVVAVEDEEEEIAALQCELDEVEKSSMEVSSTVSASALLLRIRSFVAKVSSVSRTCIRSGIASLPHRSVVVDKQRST